MTPDPFLDKSELERLTCRKKATAQGRMLDRMNIPYVVDGEGWPLVQRRHLYFDPNVPGGIRHSARLALMCGVQIAIALPLNLPGPSVLNLTPLPSATSSGHPGRLVPQRTRLGPNSVGWIEAEIEAWTEHKAEQRGREK